MSTKETSTQKWYSKSGNLVKVLFVVGAVGVVIFLIVFFATRQATFSDLCTPPTIWDDKLKTCVAPEAPPEGTLNWNRVQSDAQSIKTHQRDSAGNTFSISNTQPVEAGKSIKYYSWHRMGSPDFGLNKDYQAEWAKVPDEDWKYYCAAAAAQDPDAQVFEMWYAGNGPPNCIVFGKEKWTEGTDKITLSPSGTNHWVGQIARAQLSQQKR